MTAGGELRIVSRVPFITALLRCLLKFAGSIIFGFLLLETGIYAVGRVMHLGMHFPSYRLQHRNSFWRDITPRLGAWHPSSAAYLHRRTCFNVEYHSNSCGARDIERPLHSAGPRVIMLGDSFIEGYGVRDEMRLGNLLESATGTPHLNFGVGSNTGTIQYWVMYKELAAAYDHTLLIIGILPANDFKDNDYKRWRNSSTFRPFLAGEYPDYRLVYTTPAAPDSAAAVLTAEDFLREFTFTYNAYTYVRWLRQYGKAWEADQKGSAYYQFSDRQWLLMRYTVEQLKHSAGGRTMVIVTIPAQPDLEAQQLQGGGKPPLVEKFEELSAELGFVYVDLIAAMAAAPKEPALYLSCDGHWSEAGNEAAADYLLAELRRSVPLYSEAAGGA